LPNVASFTAPNDFQIIVEASDAASGHHTTRLGYQKALATAGAYPKNDTVGDYAGEPAKPGVVCRAEGLWEFADSVKNVGRPRASPGYSRLETLRRPKAEGDLRKGTQVRQNVTIEENRVSAKSAKATRPSDRRTISDRSTAEKGARPGALLSRRVAVSATVPTKSQPNRLDKEDTS